MFGKLFFKQKRKKKSICECKKRSTTQAEVTDTQQTSSHITFSPFHQWNQRVMAQNNKKIEKQEKQERI